MNCKKLTLKLKKITSIALAFGMVISASAFSTVTVNAKVDGDSPLPSEFTRSVVTTSKTATTTTKIKTQDAANSLISQGAIVGIDVSKWQGSIDWAKVAQDSKKVKFAFVRSNYGDATDPHFVTNVRGAQANGIKAGAYHYARFKTSAEVTTEAKAFLAQLKQVNLDYPVVLDVENHYNLSKKDLTTLCNAFIDLLEGQGYSVVIYTYNNFYKQRLDAKALKNNHIWIANYMEHPSDISHTVWQHTSYGTVSGISGKVDINLAYQDLSTGRSPGASVPTISPTVKTSSTTGSQASGLDKDGAVVSGSPTVKVTEGTTTTAKEPEKEPVAVKPVPASNDVKVSPTIHKSVVEDLNKTFGTSISTSDINMTEINKILAKGIQKELIANFNSNLIEGDSLTVADIDTIVTLTGAQISEKNITKYIQMKLCYLGYYTTEPSGKFDTATNEAIKAFQTNNGITSNGVLNKTTIKRLFEVA